MHILAAEWILRIPEGRGKDLLDAGCKAVLLVLWNHAKWKEARSATCEECYPSASTIAVETGSTLKATRKRLARLVTARWIRHEKRESGEWGWALSWLEPFPLQGDTPAGDAALPLQGPGTAPPGSGHCPSRGTKLSTNEDTQPTSEHTTALARAEPDTPNGAPTDLAQHDPPSPPQIASNSPPVSESGDDPPSPSPSPVQEQPKPAGGAGAPRKRRSKPPKPKQTALDIPDPEPIDPVDIAVADLLADHERLRAEAFAHHGLELKPKWPGRLTGDRRAIEADLRAAVKAHGEGVCRQALERRASQWRASPGNAIKHSLRNMWSLTSLVHVLASARASPGSNREQRGSGMAGDAKAAPGVWERVSQ